MKLNQGKLRKLRRFFLILALIFLFLSLFFLICIFVCLFPIGNKDFVDNRTTYYYLGAVSATIAFGLCTVQFTIRNIINENIKTNEKREQKTNEIFKEFQDLLSSNDFNFVYNVLEELENIYNLQDFNKYFFENDTTEENKNFELLRRFGGGQLKDNVCATSLLFFGDSNDDSEIPMWCSKKNPNKDRIYNYFIKRLIRVINKLEPICFLYFNDYIDNKVLDLQAMVIFEKLYVRSAIFRIFDEECGEMPYTRAAICKKRSNSIKSK